MGSLEQADDVGSCALQRDINSALVGKGVTTATQFGRIRVIGQDDSSDTCEAGELEFANLSQALECAQSALGPIMDTYLAQAANCGQMLVEVHKVVKAQCAGIATHLPLDICHGEHGHGWAAPFKNKDAITALLDVGKYQSTWNVHSLNLTNVMIMDHPTCWQTVVQCYRHYFKVEPAVEANPLSYDVPIIVHAFVKKETVALWKQQRIVMPVENSIHLLGN